MNGNPAGADNRLMGLIERSHGFAALVLVALTLLCSIPGFSTLQPIDRNESRLSLATKQMLETGGVTVVRLSNGEQERRLSGIHWLQAASVEIGARAGISEPLTRIALYRIPSLLGAIGAVLLTYWAALVFVSRREAFWAGVLLVSSILMLIEARLATIEALLAACSAAAMGGLARAYLSRGGGVLSAPVTILFWTALAFGILLKGPVLPVIAGLAVLVLGFRHWDFTWFGALRPRLGAVGALLLLMPWLLAIAVNLAEAPHEAGTWHDIATGLFSVQEGRQAPPGSYLAGFFITFWPGTCLAIIAVPFVWANRRDDCCAFILAWVMPVWLLLEVIPGKQPQSVLPLYPAIAILVVLAASSGAITAHRWGARLVALLLPAIPMLLTALFIVAGVLLERAVPFAAFPVFALAIVLSIVSWVRFMRNDAWSCIGWGCAAACCLAVAVFSLTQPVLRSLQLSPRLTETLNATQCGKPGNGTLAVGTFGYREPSLRFLIGNDLTILERPEEAAEFFTAGACRVVFAANARSSGTEGETLEDAFIAALRARNVQPRLVTRISGFSLPGAKPLVIGVYETAP